MSDMQINQVLAQMRVMASAAGGSTGEGGIAATPKADFAALMQQSLQEVSATQTQSRQLADAFEAGDPNVALPEVMVSLQKASLSFEAMNQVRNKLLNAYQEVMNMPV